ncbi:MAG: hypothetical protein ACR2HD_00660 [Solirubrobacteraceae bacterium]
MATGESNLAVAVWIAEDDDPDDHMLLTARFSGHLVFGDRPGEEFVDLDADEAIAWGSERAAVVLIRTGDSDYYSAGEHNPDPDRFLPWPPSGLSLVRRRPGGFEALDNTEAAAPVLWDVRLIANISVEIDARPFQERVRAHLAAREVQAPARGHPPTSAAFVLEAATHEQARAIAETIAKEALGALTDGRPKPGGWTLSCGAEVYLHWPGQV